MAEKKRIICLNTGEVFESITEAAAAYKLQPCEVSRVVNGKRMHCKKLIFERFPLHEGYDPDYPLEVYAGRRLCARAAEALEGCEANGS